MAHVQITYGHASGLTDPAQVLVDGVDITRSVLVEGFGVEFKQDPHHAVVTMRLRADRLDVNLPDAIVDALAVDRPTPSKED